MDPELIRQATAMVANHQATDMNDAIGQLTKTGAFGSSASSSPGTGSSSADTPTFFPEAGLGNPVPDSRVRGSRYNNGRGDGTGADRWATKPDAYTTKSQAELWIQNMYDSNESMYLKVRQELIDSGRIGPNATITEVQNAWNNIVQLSANKGASGKISPLEYLAREAGLNNPATQPRTTTSDSTSTIARNPADIAGAYQNVATQELGRRATPGEAAAAVGSVQGMGDTSTQHSVQVTDAMGNTHTTTSGTAAPGVDAINEALTQQAMSASDYAEYQAAAHYFPALVGAVGSVNSAGA